MAMTREQLLLTKIAEECSEVAKAALKAQQFGLNEENPECEFDSNKDRLTAEILDLIAVIYMLECEIESEDLLPNDFDLGPIINPKLTKVEKYITLSQELGYVEVDKLDGSSASDDSTGSVKARSRFCTCEGECPCSADV